MTGRRSVVPGLDGGKSKKKYRCQASGCGVTPRGCDLSQHYKSKTDWDMVNKMKAAMGTPAAGGRPPHQVHRGEALCREQAPDLHEPRDGQ